MTVHIMRLGTLLCGARPNHDAHNWVNCMALAVRFEAVTCPGCLKQQIADCQVRADTEATPTSAACEREAARVCRSRLSSICAKEPS